MTTAQMLPTSSKASLPSRNGHEAAAAKPPVPLPIDVTTLSAAELVALAAAATAELEKREAAFLESARDQATALGISPARLTAAIAGKPAKRVRTNGETDRRHDVVRPWRNPETGETWAGRGQPPPWVEFGDEINPKTGKKLPLAKFRIPAPEDAE